MNPWDDDATGHTHVQKSHTGGVGSALQECCCTRTVVVVDGRTAPTTVWRTMLGVFGDDLEALVVFSPMSIELSSGNSSA